jgi:hypothetical protein
VPRGGRERRVNRHGAPPPHTPRPHR